MSQIITMKAGCKFKGRPRQGKASTNSHERACGEASWEGSPHEWLSHAAISGVKHDLVEEEELLLIFLRKEFPATYLPEIGKEQRQGVNWIWVQILSLQLSVYFKQMVHFPSTSIPQYVKQVSYY